MNKSLSFGEGVAGILLLLQQAIKPIALVIAGPSCAGKSYLASQITQLISESNPEPQIIHLDNYYRDSGDPKLPKDEWGEIFDVPESFDNIFFKSNVNDLCNGCIVSLPLYDVKHNKKMPMSLTVQGTPVVIAEGLYAIDFLKELPSIINVYIDVDKELALQRRIKRDTELYQVSPEIVKHHFELRVWPKVEQYILPQKKISDLIINNIT